MIIFMLYRRMHLALQVAKTMKKAQRLVVILSDGIQNYLSKFVKDEWMCEKRHDFFESDQQSS